MTSNKKIAFLYLKNYTISLSEHVLIEALKQHDYDDVDVIDLSVLLSDSNLHMYDEIKSRIMRAECIYLSNYVARFRQYDIDEYITKIISRKINTAKYIRLLLEVVYSSDRIIIATTCCFDPMDLHLIDYIDKFCRDGSTRYLRSNDKLEDKNMQEKFYCNFDKLNSAATALSKLNIDIELHHCIGSHELINLNRPKVYKIIVPGAKYCRRTHAIDSLSTFTKFVAPKSYPVKIALVITENLYKIIKDSTVIKTGYLFANFYHRGILGASRIVYTDGSKLDLPVRKFFEIPAAGCLLLCTAFTGMSDLGFIDGVTHIECAPEDVGSLARTIDINSSAIREIIRNGQELIRQKHSANVQAFQLIEALRRAAAGRLKSAHWQEGEYVYY